MLNREKYAKEIIEIACNGGNIAVVNGKLENCRKHSATSVILMAAQ